MTKKIVVLTGSPHKPGTSEILADYFIKGAKEVGHDVSRFDAGHSKVEFLQVDEHLNGIIPQDELDTFFPNILDADLLVFVSPLYYYSFTAQLKAVIDRFYPYNHYLKDKDVMLLATGYGSKADFQALVHYYESLSDYMRWHDKGQLLLNGTYLPSDVGERANDAYQMGKTYGL